LSSKRGGKGLPHMLFLNYRNQAHKRGHTWELSERDFLSITQRECHYCGAEPAQVYERVDTGKPSAPFIYNGVDRVDNNEGYTLANCVPCCGHCNKAKLERSAADFVEWIKRVYQHCMNQKAG
jgi:5-methylcytosine-specific restriction endonuclease McrA